MEQVMNLGNRQTGVGNSVDCDAFVASISVLIHQGVRLGGCRRTRTFDPLIKSPLFQQPYQARFSIHTPPRGCHKALNWLVPPCAPGNRIRHDGGAL